LFLPTSNGICSRYCCACAMLYEELIIKDGLQEELSNDYYYKEDSQ
jgi:hypothetical protein